MMGIAWSRQSIDGAMAKAPLAQEAVGRNPTDREKMESKRHLLVDGRGVPLSLVVTGATRHDVRQLELVLDEIVIDAPDKKKVTQHLRADTGNSGEAAGLAVEARGYHPHVKQRGEEIQEKKNNPRYRARR